MFYERKCPPNTNPYMIKKGDTLYMLSQKLNISIQDIISLNPKINPSNLHIGEIICIPTVYSLYKNQTFHVSFEYPASWRMISPYRYEGKNGFFHISAISSDLPTEDICRNEALNKLKPYGSSPVITKTQINGQNGCFIFPSSDQPKEMKNQSSLILQYKTPINFLGVTYEYFILWADTRHIKHMANTFNFINI